MPHKESLLLKHASLIKQKSYELGFQYCGISKAEFLEDEAKKLEQWLKRGMQGKMKYMEKHFDKRTDPRKLVEGAKSVISLLLNYYPSKNQTDISAPQIAKYAYGKDYHFVMKDKMNTLFRFIHDSIGEVGGRVFVDSAPVMDKVWAVRSGLGWMGKNTCLINKKNGSFLFIGEIIVDIPLHYDGPIKDYCGNCSLCIDACPTQAIVEPYILDASRCISYLTIELKESEKIPEQFKGKFENWLFGCDICQDVCPWNRFSMPTSVKEFLLDNRLLKMNKNDWEQLSEETFLTVFKNSALQRAKYNGIKRNLEFLTNQTHNDFNIIQ